MNSDSCMYRAMGLVCCHCVNVAIAFTYLSYFILCQNYSSHEKHEKFYYFNTTVTL
jgi:hypothetical protein